MSASELYNTLCEANLIAELGVNFANDTPEPGKRPVREIVGMSPELITVWSSRRAAIEHRVGALAKDFQQQHGREPSAVEMLALSQQATLETRAAKHEHGRWQSSATSGGPKPSRPWGVTATWTQWSPQ